MQTSKNEQRKTQLLKDRRDYRAALIQRRNDLEIKIQKVEQDIKQLQEGK